MPGGDRTGPEGRGPKTGRGAGYCAGNDQPGFTEPGPRGGGGFGFGFGRGRGAGWGWRRGGRVRGFGGRGRGFRFWRRDYED